MRPAESSLDTTATRPILFAGKKWRIQTADEFIGSFRLRVCFEGIVGWNDRGWHVVKPLLSGMRALGAFIAMGSVYCCASQSSAGQAAADRRAGNIQGVIFTADHDGIRAVVTGAKVNLSGPQFSGGATSDESGRYCFRGVPPGKYHLEVTAPELSGSATAQLFDGDLDIPIELKPETVKQSVTVTSSAALVDATEPSDQSVVEKALVANAPNRDERIDGLLPLVPGVVRGPDGLVNMKGARASQSGYLVNSASAIDPVMGNVAVNLPIDVVESVKVISNPYDPEYGRLTGAVASVETVTGNFNKFRLSVQNLMPRPRKRDGDFAGIESSTPRITLTGPLIKNKIAFTQSFEYRFVRTPVDSLPPRQRDMKVESFNSYTQVDVNLTQRQTMTASFALFPQKINYLGLNTFVPQASTSDLHQRGYMASLQHRYAAGPDSILISQISYKRFDADVTANSSDAYRMLVETTDGGFFDRQHRQTYRTEWQEIWQREAHGFLGSHEFKVGVDFAHNRYDGRIHMLPVSIIGTSDLPIENITFGPQSVFEIHQNELAFFAADKWRLFPRLTLDLGLRLDKDSETRGINFAPRAGFALMLTRDAKTLLKGGIGLFYDRVPLVAASFPLLPERTVFSLDPAGAAVTSISYTNTITGHLRDPRSIGWNIELDRQVMSRLLVRAGFQERNTVRDFVLNPEAVSPTNGILALTSSGHSFYREFQLTGQYKIRRGTLNASYVRSKAYGNLNDFGQFFGNNAVSVIEPDARGPLPFDAPNRFLFWGQFEAPLKFTVSPVLDVHTGFPYSQFDQSREFIGPRDSLRFPGFSSVDLQVTRPITLPFLHREMKARIGFGVFNLFNHFNPRDVQSDIDSVRYGALFNGVGRMFRGKFVFDF